MHTPNTSSTRGPYHTSSLSETDGTIQKTTVESQGLSFNIDNRYKTSRNLATSIRAPRSSRSSFLVPVKSKQGENNCNRSIPGGENLESVASLQQYTPANAAAPQTKTKPTRCIQRCPSSNFEDFNWLHNIRYRLFGVVTGFAVVLPAMLFFIFSAPWL